MSDRPLLAIEGLRHTYVRGQSRVVALDGIDLSVPREGFLCVVGPSGCGKSTLLRICAGLVAPTAGAVRIHGSPIHGPTEECAIVFQDASLLPWRTVRANLTLPLEIDRSDSDRRRQQSDEVLALLGLEEFADAYPSTLSGGMAQRVAIGRALMLDPTVVLLDEPFGFLDALTRERISQELLEIWRRRRTTVLMVTHNIQEAVLLADAVVVLSSRPARVARIIPVGVDRPRHPSMVTEPPFVEAEAAVRQALAEVIEGPTSG